MYVKNVDSCATTEPFDSGASPVSCWTHCLSPGNTEDGLPAAAIVWKENTCGCVSNLSIGRCEEGTSDDYEYCDYDPALCFPG